MLTAFPKKRTTTSEMAATMSRSEHAAGHHEDDSVRYDGCALAVSAFLGRGRRTAPNPAHWFYRSYQHEKQHDQVLFIKALPCGTISWVFVMMVRSMRTDDDDELLPVYELHDRALLTTYPKRYKSRFNYSNSVTAVLSMLRFLVEQPAHISKSPSTLPWVYMERQYIQINIQEDIHTLVARIIETLIKGRTQYSKDSEMSTEQSIEALQNRRIDWLRAALLRKFDEQLDTRCIQIPISCQLGTGKTTRPTISSVYLLLDSGASFVPFDNGTLQYCIITPNKETAPSAEEDILDLMLDHAASDSAHFMQSNLTDERSDKPRSNSTTATNSDETTRDPVVQNKLTTDGENENHSNPDACVDNGDTSSSKGLAIWYMATGAARHATGDPTLITNLVLEPENNEGLCAHAADGTPMPVLGHGSVVTQNVVLPDVQYVPGLRTNLVSVGQLAGLDYSVSFGRGTCFVNSADGETVGRAHTGKDGLYEVEYLRVPLHMQ